MGCSSTTRPRCSYESVDRSCRPDLRLTMARGSAAAPSATATLALLVLPAAALLAAPVPPLAAVAAVVGLPVAALRRLRRRLPLGGLAAAGRLALLASVSAGLALSARGRPALGAVGRRVPGRARLALDAVTGLTLRGRWVAGRRGLDQGGCLARSRSGPGVGLAGTGIGVAVGRGGRQLLAVAARLGDLTGRLRRRRQRGGGRLPTVVCRFDRLRFWVLAGWRLGGSRQLRLLGRLAGRGAPSASARRARGRLELDTLGLGDDRADQVRLAEPLVALDTHGGGDRLQLGQHLRLEDVPFGGCHVHLPVGGDRPARARAGVRGSPPGCRGLEIAPGCGAVGRTRARSSSCSRLPVDEALRPLALGRRAARGALPRVT